MIEHCVYGWRDEHGVPHQCQRPVWADQPEADQEGRVYRLRLCFEHAWPGIVRRRRAIQ